MRYLVKARVKSGRQKVLLQAVDSGTLGQGSIAGDEYLHDMDHALYLSRQRLVSEVCKPLKQAVLIVRQMLRETEGYQLFHRVDPTKRRCHACPTKRTNGTKSAGQTVIKSNCHSQTKPVTHPFIMKRNSKPGKMVGNHQVAGFTRNDAHPGKLAAVAKHLTKASEVIECGEEASAAARVLSLPLNKFSLKWWHRFQCAVVDMLVHLREAILSSTLNRECRVHHSQWFQNAGVQKFVEPLATHDFEDASENVRREAVFELRPRVVFQWESRQLRHKVFQGIAISHLAIDLIDWFAGSLINDTGSVREQMLDRDRLGGGNSLRGPSCSAHDHAPITKFRNVIR